MTNEGDYREYYANITQPITTSTTSNYFEYTTPYYEMPQQPVVISTPAVYPTPLNNNKKGDDDMRYLYEVILVNPKNDEFVVDRFVAKTETSAIMQAYDEYSISLGKVAFDDLKTSCRVLFEWKKEYPKTAVE